MTAPNKALNQTLYELKRVSELDKNESVIMLGYGGAGSGKSHFGGSAGDRTIVLDTARKAKATLQSANFKAKTNNADPMIIDVAEVKVSKDGKKKTEYKAFNNTCDILDDLFQKHLDEFDTICIDELTAFGSYAMNRAFEMNRETGKSTTLSKSGVIPTPEIGDYGTEQQLLSWFLSTYIPIFRETKKHLIVLAHEQIVYQKADKIGELARPYKIMPAVPGKNYFAPDALPAFFDEVWRFTAIGQPTFQVRARTQKNDLIVARSSAVGVIDAEEINPSFPDILNRIKNQIPLKVKEIKRANA